MRPMCRFFSDCNEYSIARRRSSEDQIGFTVHYMKIVVLVVLEGAVSVVDETSSRVGAIYLVDKPL